MHKQLCVVAGFHRCWKEERRLLLAIMTQLINDDQDHPLGKRQYRRDNLTAM